MEDKNISFTKPEIIEFQWMSGIGNCASNSSGDTQGCSNNGNGAKGCSHQGNGATSICILEGNAP